MSRSELDKNPSLLDVCLTLKKSVFNDLHVSSLGIIQSINDDKAYCKLIPTTQGFTSNIVVCLTVQNIACYNIGDEVVILFTDKDSRINQNQLDTHVPLSDISEQSEKHSEAYGIIICKVDKLNNQMSQISLGSGHYQGQSQTKIDDTHSFEIHVKTSGVKPQVNDILQLVYLHSSIDNVTERTRRRYKVFAQTVITNVNDDLHITITKDVAHRMYSHSRVSIVAASKLAGIRHCYVRLARSIYASNGRLANRRYSNYVPINIRLTYVDGNYTIETI